MTAETASPLARLLEAGNDLIADALQSCERDNPDAHKDAMQFAKAGAIPRIIIETCDDLTTVDLLLIARDGSDFVRVFEYRAKRVPSARH